MKINNLLMGIALLSTTAACTSELDAPTPNGDGEEVVVTYSVTIPEGIKTRAFSDGTKACNLHYAVYEVGTAEESKASGVTAEAADASQAPLKLKLTENVTITKGETLDVDLNLIQGRQYEIAFWAQSDNAPFTYKDATQTITYDYANAVANSDDADAFYAYEKIDVKCDIREEIVLTRPFAQINFGTDDIDKAQKMGIRVNRTTISANVYTKLNLRTGKTSDEKEITFRQADLPEGEIFPAGNDYTYIAMNYVLAPEEKSLADVTLNVDNGKYTQTFTNVPLKRNYRTNIYGSLITDPANYGLTIDDTYAGEHNIYTVWDGISVEKVEPDENNEIEITSAAQLAYISQNGNQYNSNDEPNTYEGVTIKLMTDIDLNHETWRPIAATNDDALEVRGVFDGNGHTISNLHIELSGEKNNDYTQDFNAGLFGQLRAATIKNLTINHATIENKNTYNISSYTGLLAGVAAANGSTRTSIENVKVTGLIVVDAKAGYVGGLIGRAHQCNISNVEIVADEGSSVKATNSLYCGGVIGEVYYNAELKDITSNLNVFATNSNNGDLAVGGIIGGVINYTSQFYRFTCSGKIELNNYNGNNAFQVGTYYYENEDGEEQEEPIYQYPRNMSIGGLVGAQVYISSGFPVVDTFTDCDFTGTITSYYINESGVIRDVTALIKNTDGWIEDPKLYNQYWKYIGWVKKTNAGFITNETYVKTIKTDEQ
jgi:hypothetical protein